MIICNKYYNCLEKVAITTGAGDCGKGQEIEFGRGGCLVLALGS